MTGIRRLRRWRLEWTFVIAIAGCFSASHESPVVPDRASDGVALARGVASDRPLDRRLGTHFAEASDRWSRPPTLTPIPLPEIEGANAIWGSTGRDDDGNIYFGVSCSGVDQPSAALCVLRPAAKAAESLGDVVSNLRRAGLAVGRTSQMKIHGKPVQANDGYVYFASMDEQGEREDGSALPIHGSHLWRIPAGGGSWQHLAAVPEALIATACTGRYVFALGYFGHVLYRYDTVSGALDRTEVGSVGGHVSRNFLVDVQEHVYVPRVSRSDDGGPLTAEMVELGHDLREVTAHRLANYGATPDFRSHGIVSWVALRDGTLVFNTVDGQLHRLTPKPNGPSDLEQLGWIHPQGESYTAVLTCPDGERFLCAISRRPAGREYEYLLYDLAERHGRVLVLDEPSRELLARPHTLVYGSHTLDDGSGAYVVGWFGPLADLQPYVLRVSWHTPR